MTEEKTVTTQELLELQLSQLLEKNDHPVVIVSPQGQLEETTAAVEAIKEKSTGYQEALSEVPLREEVGIEYPVIISYGKLTTSFLVEHFGGFLHFLQDPQFIEHICKGKRVPFLPTLEELRFLFLFDAFLIYKSQEAAQRSNILIPEPRIVSR